MADNRISIEYNQSLKPLEKLLSEVKRGGDFFVTGSLEIPMPKLEVEGAGVISFPVPQTQAAALIGQAVRAPYGRGEETILDESVRKVWQLPPSKVRLGGKSWEANFEAILKQVIAGLGCEDMNVSAELYKLLVYDTGGFFLPHRDTEKSGGMFGTLIVCLPSSHRGGELLIRHGGRSASVDLSGGDVAEVTFAAFYADCEHEVRPVTEGNRVCLVYNLIGKGGAAGSQDATTPDYEKQIAAAAKMLEECLSASGGCAKLAWLLDHQYSPDGLSFASLKSLDAGRVKVLTQAAQRADCAAHLGIIHIEESGAAEPVYESYRSRRWRRYDDEDEESEATSSEKFEVIDVCDSRQYIDQWRNLRDQPAEFGQIPLEAGELLPAGALDGEKPDKQRLTEASGNEGASFERSYHRAALVMWRRERYADVLLQAGVEAALPYLKEKIELAGAAGAPKSARTEAAALARRAMKAWQGTPDHYVYGRSPRPQKRDVMLRLLHALGEAALLEQFIKDVVISDYDGSENAALVACAKRLSPQKIGSLFSELMLKKMPLLHGACVDLLSALAGKSKDGPALSQIAVAAAGKLDDIGKTNPDAPYAWQTAGKARAVDAALITKLFDVFDTIGAPQLAAEAAKKIAARPEVFDPVSILTPALGQMRHWDAALWEHSAEFLLRRSGQPPAAPKDWRQDVRISCSCEDCRQLQSFTRDPACQTYRFRVRQDRRQHLHQQIEHHHLDMTHVTERVGSPQTLVCAKDRRSYNRRCEQYKADIAALAALAKQARGASHDNSGLIERIDTACEAAGRWRYGT